MVVDLKNSKNIFLRFPRKVGNSQLREFGRFRRNRGNSQLREFAIPKESGKFPVVRLWEKLS